MDKRLSTPTSFLTLWLLALAAVPAHAQDPSDTTPFGEQASELTLLEDEMATPVAVTPTGGKNLIQIDDMIVEVDDKAAEHGEQATTGFDVYPSNPWPGGTLPFVFQGNNFTNADVQMIVAACNQWAAHASIRCVNRTTQTAWITVTKVAGDGCFAYFGAPRAGGGVRMNLDPGSATTGHCWTVPTVSHEIGHMLGFAHEHQRPDRDLYLDVFMQNVDQSKAGNFSILSAARAMSGYDFGSIMHYPKTAFGRSAGLVTMFPKAQYANFAPYMGTAQAPSATDGAVLRSVYGSSQSNVPGAPTLVCQCTTNPVSLRWTANPNTVAPTSYRVYVSSRPGLNDYGYSDFGLNTSWSGNLPVGTSYYIRVAAMNAQGGTYSNEVQVLVPNQTATLQLSASVAGRTVLIQWMGRSSVILAASAREDFTPNSQFSVSGNSVSAANTAPGTYYLAVWDGTRWSNVVAVTVR